MMVSPGSFPGILHCFRQLPGTPGEADESAPGDYVLLAPSGDYNQSKSTNRIRCFTSRTVLLPTSAKLTCGIWEINRGEILVLTLTVTVFKNIQEHSMKFKNIRRYSNGKIKFKNIQDFRRPVRTLITYQQQWLSYVFLFYHDGRHKHAKKLFLCFTFEILNYAIKYKI